jgi:cell division protein FtsZ
MFEIIDKGNAGYGSETVIKVIGVGDAGGNAVNHMIQEGVAGVDFIVANTDAQALKRSAARKKLRLGETGLGAGAKSEVGRDAAVGEREGIVKALEGAHMVFIVAGMGGGTGTGAAPIIAEIAHEMGILTIAVVTKPFDFEGKRLKIAELGIAELQKHVDSLIVISNDRLTDVLGDDVSMEEAFKGSDDALGKAVSGIAGIINFSGLVNVDFEDVRTMMGEMGMAGMGSASVAGADRARIATEQAVASPLLEGIKLSDARGVLVNITSSHSLKMTEVNEVMKIVRGFSADNAHIIFGAVCNDDMEDDLRVTVVATGLGQLKAKRHSGVPVACKGRSAVESPANSGVSRYDIPAFLRRPGDGHPERIPQAPGNPAADEAASSEKFPLSLLEPAPAENVVPDPALELPDARRRIVRLSEIISSPNRDAMPLAMTLGKDDGGQPVIVDLGKMPHLLVAGTTGSGKSVGIDAMILSLLHRSGPDRLRLILIDSGTLELSIYEGLPHLLAPVVTDAKQAVSALYWCLGEMERRYKLMSELGVRDIARFNGYLSSIPETSEAPAPLPYLVVVIDELADLTMVAGKKVEQFIARTAQKARASGIHLILATQRPSVDVITGPIKANIPARISYRVSSGIDSRTILDQMGAEALLGQGDMLYLAPGAGCPTRVHGAFVADDEVHRVVDYLKSAGAPDYVDNVLTGGGFDDEENGDGEADPLYGQAVEVVLTNKRASISLVQRHLRIGYKRSARLIEAMEKAGLVSAMDERGGREVLRRRTEK